MINHVQSHWTLSRVYTGIDCVLIDAIHGIASLEILFFQGYSLCILVWVKAIKHRFNADGIQRQLRNYETRTELNLLLYDDNIQESRTEYNESNRRLQ